ncbi:MAG TPA: CbtB domain-containing protein [Candidatus Acidoferrum sp.]|nr:CbtB domain-containing protein [Candidatus Acidoferrum sp.]
MRSEATSRTHTTEAARRTYAVLPAFAAAFLGAFLLWGVGFAGPMAIHNAAHDVRHSADFPCH